MKKLYLLLFFFLFFYIILNGALHFLLPDPFLRFWLNVLLLPVFMALFLVFLKITFLTPLREINRSLLFFSQTGTGRFSGHGPGIANEVKEIFASLEKVYGHLRKKTNETREAKEFLEKLMQTTQAMVVKFDRGMHPIYMNDYGLKIFQANSQGIDSLRISDFLEKKFIHEIIGALKENDHVVDRETTMLMKTGEKIDIALSFSIIRDVNKKVTGYLAVIVDISKRKKAEINLRNQIIFSQQIFQSIPEMIIIVDRKLRITFFNKRAHDVIQSGTESINGQNLQLILSKIAMESGFDELVRNVIESNNSVHRINTVNPILEEESYVDLIVEPLKSGRSNIGGIILIRDISEWRGLTAQLRSLQGFMQKLINASPYAVISINSTNLITTWNLSAEKILGVPFAAAFGQNIYTLLPLFNKYKDIINEIMILKKTIYLNDEKIFIGEEAFIVANLTLYPVTDEQNGVVIHIEDMSALKKLESSLLQAQKMESLGLLTSHIVHDFNNLLSGIMGYASLLEKKIGDEPKIKKYISSIINSSERASTLIGQLLNFSRKKLAEKEIVDINSLIKESLDFLSMSLKTIHLDVQLHPGQILLQADKTKISQTLINLLINAKDALETSPNPTITVRTGLTTISEHPNLMDGHYVRIQVGDNGRGISRENLDRIFEPFFTTKGQGRGTGQGLAIVQEIVKDFNGRIDVKSEIDRGSIFTILLPVFKNESVQAVVELEREPAAALEGLVLLVDDEDVVREIGSDMLKNMGMKCLTATNGSEGIDLFKKNKAVIKLVILDVEMPGISGEKVFQVLKEIDSGVKILVASGYGKEYLETTIFKGKIENFLAKPFNIEQLSYQIGKLLGGKNV
ncbi:MAG: PAS domain S-box protein [Candidatus Aminicenantes bacterium]|nr:PAS domain S-box protein [Candidatus Aminicenantes bacterium]